MTATATLGNLREVGGPGLQRGRARTVYRANTEDVGQEAYPRSVRTVVDLRRADEIAALPHPLGATLGYRNVPLFDPTVPDEAVAGALTLEAQYVDWLDRHRATIGEVFRTIAAAEGDLLVCCAAGKDRTGVVSALLARLWGADSNVIGADYAATGPALAERFRRERATTTDPEQTARNQRCVPETAVHVVSTVEERFGSVRGYLLWVGLSEGEIDSL
ncbi:tyrosine-protein phosphatase [Lacisediminihabitans sp.]|uniref:tyrosine-protein phosphatase n=1 Tax=Lacisediminihabitans sp. TaxID=2787631 RepID=UPI00374D62B9